MLSKTRPVSLCKSDVRASAAQYVTVLQDSNNVLFTSGNQGRIGLKPMWNSDTNSKVAQITTRQYVWKHADKILNNNNNNMSDRKQERLTVLIGVRTIHHDVRLRGGCCSTLRHKRTDCFFLQGNTDFACINSFWQKPFSIHSIEIMVWYDMICCYHY